MSGNEYPGQVEFRIGDLIIPPSENIRVENANTFIIRAGKDRGDEIKLVLELLEEMIREICVCFFHCFDGRAFWRKLWRYILTIVEAIRILRISLAGSATGSDLYLKYLDRLESYLGDVLRFGDILFPVITHSPCGRFSDLSPKHIALKGSILARKLLDSGKKAFSVHLNLADDGIEVWLDDYNEITKSHPLAANIYARALSLTGTKPEEEKDELKYLPDLVLVKATMAMGYPPLLEDPTLVLCEVDSGETRKAIVTASELRRGPVPVDPVAFYFNSA